MIAELLMGAALAVPAKAKPVPAKCSDKTAVMLHKAGFTGRLNRQAWAIVYRESRGQNLIPGHPQFNGSDWGVWQVNRGAHGGNRWWTEDNMSDPAKQSRIVWRLMTKKGTYWRPWGITADGNSMDTTHYSMWSSSQQWAWIWAGYQQGLAMYPSECAK